MQIAKSRAINLCMLTSRAPRPSGLLHFAVSVCVCVFVGFAAVCKWLSSGTWALSSQLHSSCLASSVRPFCPEEVIIHFAVQVIEFARNVLGLKEANSTEFAAATPHPLVVFMPEISTTHKVSAVLLTGCCTKLGCIAPLPGSSKLVCLSMPGTDALAAAVHLLFFLGIHGMRSNQGICTACPAISACLGTNRASAYNHWLYITCNAHSEACASSAANACAQQSTSVCAIAGRHDDVLGCLPRSGNDFSRQTLCQAQSIFMHLSCVWTRWRSEMQGGTMRLGSRKTVLQTVSCISAKLYQSEMYVHERHRHRCVCVHVCLRVHQGCVIRLFWIFNAQMIQLN